MFALGVFCMGVGTYLSGHVAQQMDRVCFCAIGLFLCSQGSLIKGMSGYVFEDETSVQVMKLMGFAICNVAGATCYINCLTLLIKVAC